MKRKKVLLLTGDCTAKGCRKRSIRAEKIGDFWVENCEEHSRKEFTMDLDKIGVYIAEGSVALRYAPRGKCRFCGCTDAKACDGGCSWIEPSLTVCSSDECVRKFEELCDGAEAA